jgi:CRISPR/Cas system-associated exonuclease Cas4 (RecB family)
MASRDQTAALELPAHVARVQSPSSINMWKQCPRKYWYRYWAHLPTRPSIHLARGTVVHSTLELFFDTDVTNVPDDPEKFLFTMKVVLNELFRRLWNESEDLKALGMSDEELLGYYDETKRMVNNYFDYFTDKTRYFLRFLPMKEAWEAVKPAREVEFSSDRHYVRGFMDAIHDEAGKTLILDYKTSRRAHITPEYQLQLSIYALLYQERFHTPDLVGIYFLKEGKEELLDVTPEMIERAKREVEEVHLGTNSPEMEDYPKRPSPLCKWSTGQCDYYEYCYEGKPLPERKE